MSNFCPDTRGRWWTLFLGSFVQSCCGEGGTLKTSNTGMCLQCLGHTGFAPAHGVCTFPVYTAYALGCSAGNCLRPALGCTHFPGLSRPGSGTWVVLRGADSVGPAFCALPRSEQLRWPGVWWEQLLRLIAFPSLLLGFLGIQPVHHLRQMLTVQNPKKSWLATKPACSLVDNASLGPQLPPSGFGCPRLPVTREGWVGLQRVSSAQSFVLWAGQEVS